MDVRLKAAVAAGLEGVNKSALCRELGISRDSLYRYAAAFEAEGLAGLEPRSRRPHRSPSQVSPGIEELIVRARKELLDAGLDAGPWSIHYRLACDGVAEVPHPATIWRVLTRRGLIVPEPAKRPKKTYRRFEADRPNELWQIDATHAVLANGTTVEIINVIDDHSRLNIASIAVAVTTASTAWAALTTGIQAWGAPQQVLSDNGAPFVARTVTANLTALGITRTRSRPYHPETNGKVERFHQTQRRWLTGQPAPTTLEELQTLLDRFTDIYNHHRPHRAVGRRPPMHRWTATPPAVPTGLAITTHSATHHAKIAINGTVTAGRYAIALGAPWAGHHATVIVQDLHAAVFVGDTLARQLTLDPSRRYQPTGKPRGGPRQPRHT